MEAALLLEPPAPPGSPTAGTKEYAYPLPPRSSWLVVGKRRSWESRLSNIVASTARLVTYLRARTAGGASRPNGGKVTAGVVPLWPQLETILRPWVFNPDHRRALSFSGVEREGDAVRYAEAADRIAARAGWPAGEIRSRIFRNTYCAARLQTLDHGARWLFATVSRELGHRSTAMVVVYVHLLGKVRYSGPRVLEFWSAERSSVKSTSYLDLLRLFFRILR